MGRLLLVLLIVALIICAILFGPLLVIWGINTLLLGYIPGAGQIPYTLFTWQWFAALLTGGIGVGSFSRGSRSS